MTVGPETEKVVVLSIGDWATVSGTLAGLWRNFPESDLCDDWKRLEESIDLQIKEQP